MLRDESSCQPLHGIAAGLVIRLIGAGVKLHHRVRHRAERDAGLGNHGFQILFRRADSDRSADDMRFSREQLKEPELFLNGLRFSQNGFTENHCRVS